MVGLFATRAVNPTGLPADGLVYGGGFTQLGRQAIAAGAVGLYSFVVTLVIGYLITVTIGFRVRPESEAGGLDLNEHAETGYELGLGTGSGRGEDTPALLELSWLRSAHVQAYLRSSTPSVAGEWHLRRRPAVIERLSKVINRRLCRPGEHLVSEDQSQRQTPPPPPVRPGEPVRRPVPAGRQLALHEHWNANYTAALEADLAWRVQREANQA
jgi:hypothetical protein